MSAKMPRVPLVLLTCLAALTASAGSVSTDSPAVSAPASQHPTSVLAQVKELEKPVTLTEAKIPLGELVQKVAADTGAPLATAPGVADEPVAVAVRELPARELLDELADLLDYQWHRRPGPPTPNAQHPMPTYEIWQDLASKQREEAQRQAVTAEVEKRFREVVQQYTEVAALPPQEFQRLVAAAEKDQQERGDVTPAQQAALMRDPQERLRRLRFLAAMELRSPVYRSEASLLARLSAAQWTRLRDDGQIIFSTDPRAGELKLPAETERLLHGGAPTLLRPGAHLAYPDPVEEEKLYQRQKQLQEAWSAASGYRVSLRLDSSRLKTEGGLNLSADVQPYRNGEPLGLGFITPGTALRLMGGARFLGQEFEEDTPERRAALEKDPVLGARKRFKPEAKPHPSEASPVAPGWWPLGELLPELARAYDVDFIADSYWHSTPGLAQDSIPAEPVPLFSLLDRAALSSCHWDRRGRLVRLRSRTWFLDRPQEVPLRLVRRWKTLLKERAALPLEDYLDMATTLTDAQLQGLGRVIDAARLPADFYSLDESRPALRLYHSLRPAQQQALWTGQPLPVAQMPPEPRALFAAGLKDRLRRDPAALVQAEEPSFSFRITTEPLVRVKEGPENGPTYRDEPVPAPAASIDAAGRSHYPVTRVRFQFQYAPDRRDSTSLIVASPP